MKKKMIRLAAYAVTAVISMAVILVYIWAIAQANNAGQQVLSILIAVLGLAVPVVAYRIGEEMGGRKDAD